MEELEKNIGFVAYPKLNMPGPHTGLMETPKLKIPTRLKIAGRPVSEGPVGAVLANSNANKAKGLPGKQQRLSGFVNTESGLALHGIQGHEQQHTVFTKIRQIHGANFKDKLVNKTLEALSPKELKVLSYVNISKDKYAPEKRAEELLTHFHNYLQDPGYRKLVHKSMNLSDKGALTLQNAAKTAWKKLRAHAATLDFDTVNKSENTLDEVLSKVFDPEEFELLKMRPSPVFPKLGVPDRRNEIDYINEPKRLLTKLRTMAHAGAKQSYEGGVWRETPTGTKKVPASQITVRQRQADAKIESNQQHQEVVGRRGASAGQQRRGGGEGYALSGVLRPTQWVDPNEDESRGTKQHEEFHSQMSRVEEKHGKHSRRALAENLWNALPKDQQHVINYLQDYWAGDLYDKKSPSSATEEKIARVFNHLNSPTTRMKFHSAQGDKTHELSNGDIAPENKYVVPGLNQLSGPLHFDNTLKAAHRNLLAAAETADERWLKHGHVGSENKPIQKSETAAHMLGFSVSMQSMCRAARFLSGKKVDEKTIKNAIIQMDGDLKQAVLVAHNIEPNKGNIKALEGLVKIQDLHKSFLEPQHSIKPGHPDSEALATELENASANGDIEPVELGGKHSAGSLLVKLGDGENWLIKPESNKESPAAGVKEEQASQSARETAFWHIANSLGLGYAIPKAELIFLDSKPAAAIKMLPFDWQNIEDAKTNEPNVARIAFEPYRVSGELFKWAVLDYILGQTDRHFQNVMVSSKDDGYKIALIDHGSAFAGNGFAPGIDSETWTPCYLRCWSTRGWSKLTSEEKLKALPRAPIDSEQKIYHWLLGINPEKLAPIMQRYGINTQPALDRLDKLKQSKEPIDLYIGKLWCGLV